MDGAGTNAHILAQAHSCVSMRRRYHLRYVANFWLLVASLPTDAMLRRKKSRSTGAQEGTAERAPSNPTTETKARRHPEVLERSLLRKDLLGRSTAGKPKGVAAKSRPLGRALLERRKETCLPTMSDVAVAAQANVAKAAVPAIRRDEQGAQEYVDAKVNEWAARQKIEEERSKYASSMPVPPPPVASDDYTNAPNPADCTRIAPDGNPTAEELEKNPNRFNIILVPFGWPASEDEKNLSAGHEASSSKTINLNAPKRMDVRTARQNAGLIAGVKDMIQRDKSLNPIDKWKKDWAERNGGGNNKMLQVEAEELPPALRRKRKGANKTNNEKYEEGERKLLLRGARRNRNRIRKDLVVELENSSFADVADEDVLGGADETQNGLDLLREGKGAQQGVLDHPSEVPLLVADNETNSTRSPVDNETSRTRSADNETNSRRSGADNETNTTGWPFIPGMEEGESPEGPMGFPGGVPWPEAVLNGGSDETGGDHDDAGGDEELEGPSTEWWAEGVDGTKEWIKHTEATVESMVKLFAPFSTVVNPYFNVWRVNHWPRFSQYEDVRNADCYHRDIVPDQARAGDEWFAIHCTDWAALTKHAYELCRGDLDTMKHMTITMQVYMSADDDAALRGQQWGWGSWHKNFLIMSARTNESPEFRGALLAHELSHALFGLTDEYNVRISYEGELPKSPNCGIPKGMSWSDGQTWRQGISWASYSSTTPACCWKWEDLIANDMATCEPGCGIDKQYCVGMSPEKSLMAGPRKDDSLSHVQLRVTCCKYLTMLKHLPGYCDKYNQPSLGLDLNAFCADGSKWQALMLNLDPKHPEYRVEASGGGAQGRTGGLVVGTGNNYTRGEAAEA